MHARTALFAAILAGFLGGCERSVPQQSKLHRTSGKVLRVLVWDGYFPESIRDHFSGQFEIKTEHYESNEKLYAILTGRDPEHHEPYDLAMPSSFLASRLLHEGQLRAFARDPIDHTYTVLLNLNAPEDREEKGEAPAHRNLDPHYNIQADPANDYVLPYVWASTGIGYNIEKVGRPPISWGDFFIPHHGEARRLALVNDGRFVLGSALIYELSLELAAENKNAGLTNPQLSRLLARAFANASDAQIRKAGEWVKGLHDEIVCVNTDHIPEVLASGVADMAIGWSGDIAAAMGRGGDPPAPGRKAIPANLNIRMSLPIEGAVIMRDCWVIPHDSAHPAEAEALINYLYDPVVAGQVSDYSYFPTTVPTASPNVDPMVANSAAYFVKANPDKNIFLERGRTGAQDRTFRQVWDEVCRSLPAGVFQYPPVIAPGQGAADEEPAIRLP